MHLFVEEPQSYREEYKATGCEEELRLVIQSTRVLEIIILNVAACRNQDTGVCSVFK